MDKEIRIIPKNNRLFVITLWYFYYIIGMFIYFFEGEGRTVSGILTMIGIGIFMSVFCYYISIGLTKIYIHQDGCIIIRGRKKLSFLERV